MVSELDSPEWFIERQRELDEVIASLTPEQHARFDREALTLARVFDSLQRRPGAEG